MSKDAIRKHPAMGRVKDAFSCPAVRQDDR